MQSRQINRRPASISSHQHKLGVRPTETKTTNSTSPTHQTASATRKTTKITNPSPKVESFTSKLDTSLRILRAFLFVSLIASLGNLRLHGHVELEFAGMNSSFDIPKTELVMVTSSKQTTKTYVEGLANASDVARERSKHGMETFLATRTTMMRNQTAETRIQQQVQFRPGQLIFYDGRALARDRQLFLLNDPKITPIILDLIQQANSAMKSGPWSVMDKPDDSVAPSGLKGDFFNIAPYYHTQLGDGIRMIGTTFLHEKGSEKYDRTRFKDMRYNTTILALAYTMTRRDQYAFKIVDNIRVWFVTHATRMNANMKYAHEKPGLKKTIILPPPQSIDMMGDIYFLLDAVRLVDGFFNPVGAATLRRRLTKYLGWLDRSISRHVNTTALQYYGPFLDIQAVAIAAHLDDLPRMERYIERAIARMTIHIDHDTGEMPPDVMKADDCETRLLHSLQGWSIMSRLTMTVNRNLWKYHPSMQNDTESLLCRASRYVIPFYGRKRQCSRRMQRVPAQSWWPLFYESQMYCPSLQRMTLSVPTWLSRENLSPEKGKSSLLPPASVYDMPSLYDPKYGIAPFWHLGKLFLKE